MISFSVLKGLKQRKFMNNCKKCIRSPQLQNALLNFELDPRERRPKTAITSEIIEQVQNIVSENPSLTKSVKLLMPEIFQTINKLLRP